MPEFINTQMQETNFELFCDTFSTVAVFQGRLAYCLMSIYAVNPNLLNKFFRYDLHMILYSNMIYGIGVMIYFRPFLRPINRVHKIILSILGTYMFNHSSLEFYRWLCIHFAEHPKYLTLMGFISGRFMISYFLAFMYHIDLRFLGRNELIRLNSNYDSLYFT